MSQQSLVERNAQLAVVSENLATTRMELTTTRSDLFATTKEKEERGFLVEEHQKTEKKLLGEAGQVRHYSRAITMLISFGISGESGLYECPGYKRVLDLGVSIM